MLTLYGHPYSQHSRRVVALLEETGISYDFRQVALDSGEHMQEDFLELNPNHQVPTLVDEDFVLTESNAMLRYLCNKHELSDWYPAASRVRARIDQWLDWNQCRLSPAVIDIVLNKVFLGDAGDPKAIERGERALPELAGILSNALEGRAFLVGEAPTIADLSVASNVFHLGFAKASPDQPNITAWLERIMAIGGFARSLPKAA